jgi:LysM repeat protein
METSSKMWLFSLLLPTLVRRSSQKRCRIKGLSAKSRVLYEVVLTPIFLMMKHLMAKSIVALAVLTTLTGALITAPAQAQNYPITAGQKATANQVASKGVPLSELAPDAPESYTIKRGDTLWAISKLYLTTPWRWPELWGMNLSDIKNPHRIYPGQVLKLERLNGVARLTTGEAEPEVVKLSPRTRYESLADNALPTLNPRAIEPFLAEPLVVDDAEFRGAPRIVSAQEGRVLLSKGDRAYVRGQDGNPLLDDEPQQKMFRVFRNATPLKDPESGEVLGYEAQYVGKATLVRGESAAGGAIVPATIDIVGAKEEMRVGDRLLPEPPRQFLSYIPHAPAEDLVGSIISVYGSAVVNAAQNQVVAINKGTRDGLEAGHVMAILKRGARVIDKGDDRRPLMQLPNERNGLLMVFRTFDRVSYGLILEITDGVRVGDRLVSPR